MAKPNYQFEKRQRDLAKKKKQEEKRLQKLAAKAVTPESGGDAAAPLSSVAPVGDSHTAVPTPDSE
ncbi:MAG: hypothetical protein IPG33_04815 [Betaproteobacteria bacterium]|nr:hypothetical protein [Betaproteobacteria bacterium]